MKTLRRVGWLVWLASSAVLRAADPVREPDLNSIRQIAEMGRYELALRAVDRNLLEFPGDPRLLALRAQVAELLARNTGNATAIPAATVRLPAIADQRAEAGRDFTTPTAGIAMLWIAPGSFLMSNPQGSDDDTFVTLSHGYWLGRTEVTQEQWQAVMENIPSPSQFKGSDRPVERVSWVSAEEFCHKLSERERAAGRLPAGYEYALPTEAQWEYACRAGTTGPYAGNLADLGWFELNSDLQSHPVGQKRPNAWGLYDMHGNVAEWCADGYNGYPGGRATDPMGAYDGPSSGISRILRGGAAGSSAGQCRSGLRMWMSLNFLSGGTGLRLALAPERSATPTSK